jgi:hypothetical protein
MRVDWLVAPFTARCGGCGNEIPKDAPRRALRVGGVRCAACAKRSLNEDPPPDLEQRPLPPLPMEPRPMPDRVPLRPKPPRLQWFPDVDFKSRQGNDHD